MDSEAMFRPFAPLEEPAGNSTSGDGWHIVLPVPEDAQSPEEVAARFVPDGYRLADLWKYPDPSGNLMGCVARYDHKDGADRKQYRPLTYWESDDGSAKWRAAGFPPKRPLYRLDLLGSAPQDPVLVVEGEKAADAAQLRFPGYVVTTSLGGAKAAAIADWSPLRDRVVTIWPDADEAGHHYAKDVVAQLDAVAVASIRMVAVPTSFPPDGISRIQSLSKQMTNSCRNSWQVPQASAPGRLAPRSQPPCRRLIP